MPDTRGVLERLARALAETLATVTGKEKSLNASFRELATEYRACATSTEDANAAYASASGRAASLAAELNTLSEALEELKGVMDDKGSSMTDTSPLIRVKAALAALRAESKALDLHIGVVGHAVMQSKVQHKVGAAASAATRAHRVYSGAGHDDDGDVLE